MGRDTKIKDVESKQSYDIDDEYLVRNGTAGVIPINRDAIALYVDEPCLEACKKLYDLNIQTYSSGGHVNKKDNIESIAFISVIYDSLSNKNKEVVDSLIKEGIIKSTVDTSAMNHGYVFNIEVPIHSDDLVVDVSNQLMSIVNSFKQQDVLYGRFTLEQLKKIYFSKKEEGIYRDNIIAELIDETEVNERFLDYLNSGIFKLFTDNAVDYFMSEDLLNKHNKYINSKENKEDDHCVDFKD